MIMSKRICRIQLYDLVETYQKINQSKHVDNTVMFHADFILPNFFTRRTIVAELLSREVDKAIKCNILEKRNKMHFLPLIAK